MSLSSTSVLLPAIKYANVMGRYLKLIPKEEADEDNDSGEGGGGGGGTGTSNNNLNDKFNSWKGTGVVFDWPGVQLTFRNVRNTTTIKIKMRGGLSVFGYRVVRNDSRDGDGYFEC